MSDKFHTTELHTSDARTWTFNVDELDAFRLDAPSSAKSAVAEATDARYRDLRAKLVNSKSWGDTYVVVVEVFG